jgi:uncharacterized protein YciI
MMAILSVNKENPSAKCEAVQTEHWEGLNNRLATLKLLD